MKAFSTLQKLARRTLDEVSIEVSRLRVREAEMLRELETLDARETAETATAHSDPDLYSALPAFRERVAGRRRDVKAQLADIHVTLIQVRDRLDAAYREKSKFDQLIGAAAERDRAEALAREQTELDESAVQRAGRE